MKIYKAFPIGEAVPNLNLIATESIPDSPINESGIMKTWSEFYQEQAEFICTALRKSLPRGTWDRLIAAMVREHATILKVTG